MYHANFIISSRITNTTTDKICYAGRSFRTFLDGHKLTFSKMYIPDALEHFQINSVATEIWFWFLLRFLEYLISLVLFLPYGELLQ